MRSMRVNRLSSRSYPRWLLAQSVGGGALLVSLGAVATDDVVSVALITLWCGVAFGRLVTLGGGLHGPADLVTTVRLAAAVAWLLFINPGAASAGLLALILALDLVDGWLARRFGPTPQGAIYDMEADQLTVLILAYHAVSQGLPVWVLVMPGLKYVSVLLSSFLGLPFADPKPKDGDNRRGRLVCAFTFVALWSVSLPGVSSSAKTALVAAALGLLLLSFSDDLRFLLHKEARAPELT